jgi:hypothetical protein
MDFCCGFEVSFSGCALLLGTWLSRGGESCNVKSERLCRGRGSATMTHGETPSIEGWGSTGGLQQLGARRGSCLEVGTALRGCLSLTTMTGRRRLLRGSWRMARGWPIMGSRSCWQHCFHAR